MDMTFLFVDILVEIRKVPGKILFLFRFYALPIILLSPKSDDSNLLHSIFLLLVQLCNCWAFMHLLYYL